MKKMVSIIWILLFLVCIGIYLCGLADKERQESKTEYSIETLSSSESSQIEIQEREQETLSQEGLGAGDYRAVVDEAQLKSMNEWYEVYDSFTGNAYRYQIISAEKSRILREDFKKGAVDFESSFFYYTEYYRNVMSEEGNFESGFYYLYVEVEVCNIGKKNEMFIMNCFPYLKIDEDCVATLISVYNNEDIYFTNDAVYFLVAAGNNVIDDKLTAITPFDVNAQCRYTMCYIITEQMAEDNNLYIYKSDGRTGSRV